MIETLEKLKKIEEMFRENLILEDFLSNTLEKIIKEFNPILHPENLPFNEAPKCLKEREGRLLFPELNNITQKADVRSLELFPRIKKDKDEILISAKSVKKCIGFKDIILINERGRAFLKKHFPKQEELIAWKSIIKNSRIDGFWHVPSIYTGISGNWKCPDWMLLYGFIQNKQLVLSREQNGCLFRKLALN